MVLSKKLFFTTIIASIAIGFFIWKTQTFTKLQFNFPQINSFHEAQSQLDQLKPGDFVFFDTDDTLLSAQDYLPRHFAPPALFKMLALIKHPRLLYDRGYGEHIFSQMLLQAPRFLIEPGVISIINGLRERGVYVMVITGMESGKFGDIESMPTWRSTMLEELGLQFEREFTNTTFDMLPTYRGDHPVLYNGLICCNQRSKGEVIGAFLDRFKLKPATVALFDDSPEELDSLEKLGAGRNIKTLLFHCRAHKAIEHPHWNIWGALKQLDNLVNQGTWISDAKAAGAE